MNNSWKLNTLKILFVRKLTVIILVNQSTQKRSKSEHTFGKG